MFPIYLKDSEARHLTLSYLTPRILVRFVYRATHVLTVAFALSLATGVTAQANDFTDFLKNFLGNDKQQQRPADEALLGATNHNAMKRVPLSQGEMMFSFAPLVEKAAPAVVNVYASRMTEQRASPFADDPFFEQFFGRRMPLRQQSSLGSGVIVEENGLVVTNHHVIAGADEIKVALADGREFGSRVLLQDEKLDLAVLQLDTDETFPTITLDDSDDIAVGDLVLAIGNPFGVGQTTTSGIISATARNRIGVSDFGFFIQTDAAINPGNSGGALIGMNGRLMGINTAIFTRSGGSNGIGFAIPSNMVAAFLHQAKNGGEAFEAPWLGARFDLVTPNIAESVGLSRPMGALIVAVEPDSPAADASLRAGDVIIAIDGQPIQHPDALGYRLATKNVGDVVALLVQRKFKAIDVSVTLIKRPASARNVALSIEGRSPFGGATVVLEDGRKAQIRGEAVMIAAIERGSPAAQVGMRPGDFVVEVNGEAITELAQLNAIANSDTRWWRFTLNRNGRLFKQVLRY